MNKVASFAYYCETLMKRMRLVARYRWANQATRNGNHVMIPCLLLTALVSCHRPVFKGRKGGGVVHV